MKRLITTLAVVFCIMSSNAQKQNYIKRDTIQVLTYRNHPHYIIKRTEMGDPEYWKRKHRRERRWNRVGLGIFSTLTMVGFIVTSK